MAENMRAAEPAAVVRSDTGTAASHIDWQAIFVGALLATAVSFVLNTFGAAIGLSVVSPFGEEGTGGTALLIAVALWTIWVLVSSHMAGAYVTGRMRRRLFDATEHESDVRDGVHGLAVWALGVLFSAFLLAATVDTAARTGAQVATAAGDAVSELAGPGYAYELNQLLRPAEPGGYADAALDPLASFEGVYDPSDDDEELGPSTMIMRASRKTANLALLPTGTATRRWSAPPPPVRKSVPLSSKDVTLGPYNHPDHAAAS